MFTLKAPFAIISVPNLMKGAFTMDNISSAISRVINESRNFNDPVNDYNRALLIVTLVSLGKSKEQILEILSLANTKTSDDDLISAIAK